MRADQTDYQERYSAQRTILTLYIDPNGENLNAARTLAVRSNGNTFDQCYLKTKHLQLYRSRESALLDANLFGDVAPSQERFIRLHSHSLRELCS